MSVTLHVVNETSHEFEVIGRYGDNFEDVTSGTIITAGASSDIGSIAVPSIAAGQDYWGWVYLQDRTNKIMFELYVFTDKKDDAKYRASIGQRSNFHDSDNPIPYPLFYLIATMNATDRRAVYILKQMPR